MDGLANVCQASHTAAAAAHGLRLGRSSAPRPGAASGSCRDDERLPDILRALHIIAFACLMLQRAAILLVPDTLQMIAPLWAIMPLFRRGELR